MSSKPNMPGAPNATLTIEVENAERQSAADAPAEPVDALPPQAGFFFMQQERLELEQFINNSQGRIVGRAGSIFKGQLVLQNGPEELRISAGGIDLWLGGGCTVTVHVTRRDANGHSHTESHRSEAIIVKQAAETLPPATHHTIPPNARQTFPFLFTLPEYADMLPGTMISRDVQIHYAIRAIAHISGGLTQANLCVEQPIFVAETFPTEPQPEAMNQLIMANEMKIHKLWFAPCDCFGFETLRSHLIVPSIAWMNNEEVKVRLAVENFTTFAIDRMDVELHEINFKRASGHANSNTKVVWKQSIPLSPPGSAPGVANPGILPNSTLVFSPSFIAKEMRRNLRLENYTRTNKMKISLHVNGHFEHAKFEFPIAGPYEAPMSMTTPLPPLDPSQSSVYPQVTNPHGNFTDDDFKSNKSWTIKSPFQEEGDTLDDRINRVREQMELQQRQYINQQYQLQQAPYQYPNPHAVLPTPPGPPSSTMSTDGTPANTNGTTSPQSSGAVHAPPSPSAVQTQQQSPYDQHEGAAAVVPPPAAGEFSNIVPVAAYPAAQQ